MFLFASILSEVRISDQIVFFVPVGALREYSLGSLHRDCNTGAIQRDRLLSGHVSGFPVPTICCYSNLKTFPGLSGTLMLPFKEQQMMIVHIM